MKVLNTTNINYDNHFIGCDYLVQGENDIYLVKICSKVSCGCPDYDAKCLGNDIPCKHILWVMLDHIGFNGDVYELATLRYSDEFLNRLDFRTNRDANQVAFPAADNLADIFERGYDGDQGDPDAEDYWGW